MHIKTYSNTGTAPPQTPLEVLQTSGSVPCPFPQTAASDYTKEAAPLAEAEYADCGQPGGNTLEIFISDKRVSYSHSKYLYQNKIFTYSHSSSL